MRTIKLTHQEIQTIQRALAMAEAQFSKMRTEYINNAVNVRGVYSETTAKEVDFMFEIENSFCDLLTAIKNGDKDV